MKKRLRISPATVLMGLSSLLVLSITVGLVPVAAADGGGLDGEETFLAQKCNTCHSVSTAGIEAKTTSEKMKGPDLVGVGERHDEEWIVAFVRREVELDGDLHKKPYKGTDEELAAIVEWLLEQKADDEG